MTTDIQIAIDIIQKKIDDIKAMGRKGNGDRQEAYEILLDDIAAAIASLPSAPSDALVATSPAPAASEAVSWLSATGKRLVIGDDERIHIEEPTTSLSLCGVKLTIFAPVGNEQHCEICRARDIPTVIGPQQPPNDPMIFNRQQSDGTYRPVSEFFDTAIDIANKPAPLDQLRSTLAEPVLHVPTVADGRSAVKLTKLTTSQLEILAAASNPGAILRTEDGKNYRVVANYWNQDKERKPYVLLENVKAKALVNAGYFVSVGKITDMQGRTSLKAIYNITDAGIAALAASKAK